MREHPYASARYAQSFGEDYAPIYLEEAKIHVLKRSIPGTDDTDAMGIYPLTPITENANLQKDFVALQKQNIVSLVLVSDPFFHPPKERLADAFDTVADYKTHYVYNFSKGGDYSKHHRYEIKRAWAELEVRVIDLTTYLQEWWALYSVLIAHRGITGLQAFSPDYFSALCALNPFTVGAFHNGALVSAHIWFSYQDVAYSHLAASNEEGYRLSASYAIYDTALAHFRENGIQRVDLGAGAGISDASKGLEFFKKGFSNESMPCYLCCKILDEDRYAALSAGKKTAFFPAYRG